MSNGSQIEEWLNGVLDERGEIPVALDPMHGEEDWKQNATKRNQTFYSKQQEKK